MIRVLGFDSWQGLGIFLFTTMSRTALGPTQPPIQLVPGALSLRVKWPGHEADHSLPPSAKIKELVQIYLHSPNTLSWCGAQLKHRDNFTFTFTFLQYCYYIGDVCASHIIKIYCICESVPSLSSIDICNRVSYFIMKKESLLSSFLSSHK
jgi:hypothetical protein